MGFSYPQSEKKDKTYVLHPRQQKGASLGLDPGQGGQGKDKAMGDLAVQEVGQVKREQEVAVGDPRYRSMNRKMELVKDHDTKELQTRNESWEQQVDPELIERKGVGFQQDDGAWGKDLCIVHCDK
jgi:hypothetical protein